ncbi:MAG: hypothetical protein K9L17_12350 [Clostridiales bacterium]|nr:hypothetical protein [Clostridiales bacterium]MCF8023473.1 hypothetical protein [Clostridiales bacterium]
MRMRFFLPVAVILLLVFPAFAFAGTAEDVEAFVGQDNATSRHMIGAKASSAAMDKLSFTRGDSNILAMTDAGYAIINGKTTEKCVDGITAVSGCTVGAGNLLMVQRSKEKPLWFAFFDKNTGQLVYMQVKESVINKSVDEIEQMAAEDIFTIISRENVVIENLMNNPGKWKDAAANKVFGGNEFSLIGIANIWAHPDCTYDFLQAAEFHNHLCPGVTSGYLIIKYLDRYLPLQQGEGYNIIACPNWCKEDAFQAVLDATPGKRGLYVKKLTAEQEKQLLPEAKNIAGLYIRWDGSSGDGLALGFDFDKVRALANTKDFSGPGWIAKLKMNMVLMDYLDNPGALVKTIKSFKVDQAELTNLQSAGVNPLQELGLMKSSEIVLNIGDKNASKNGKTVELSQPARIINKKTMVPLRFISEALGAGVQWDSNTQTVRITEN